MKKISLILLLVVIFTLTIPLSACGRTNYQSLHFELQSDGTYAATASGLDNLKSIVIPTAYNGRSVTEVSFSDCTSLKHVKIPDSVESIAFRNCTSLKRVKIPDSVESIVFRNCQSLKHVKIPDSVTTIGFEGFYWCTSLKSITIPDSVTYIGGFAFYNCTSLTRIKFEGTVEQWNTIQKGSDLNYKVPATEVICSDGVVPLT